MQNNKVKTPRRFEGRVVSTKMAKTAVVVVDRKITHPVYHKQFTRSEKFKIHDEKGVCHVGDKVSFEECRPLSKEKRWHLLEVLSK